MPNSMKDLYFKSALIANKGLILYVVKEGGLRVNFLGES